MSSESQRAVKVRLEIEIPQGGPADADRRLLVERELFLASFLIDEPPFSSTATPAVNARQDLSVGNWLICTRGSFPAGALPQSVFAAVYPKDDPRTLLSGPPEGTAGQTVDTNRRWGLKAPFELPVPHQDGTYTFVAWADLNGSYTRLVAPGDLPRDFTIIKSGVTRCGLGSGSGSGSGGGIITLAALGVSIPTTLYAHLSNAGALSGAHALVYDPNTKAWNSDAICGPHGFRLLCVGPNWQLNVKGPKTYQPSVAQCGPSPPFQIAFHNVDLSTPGHGGTAKAAVEILLSGG